MAFKGLSSANRKVCSLEYALFLFIVVAVSTKMMGWLAILHSRLQRKGKSATTNLGQLIPLTLSIPVFKASNLCFKITYLIHQRELVRLGRKCAALGGQDYSLEFDDLRLDVTNRLDLQKALSDVGRRLEASDRRRNGSYINH